MRVGFCRFVTFSAKGSAVAQVKAKLRKVRKWLDVVGVKNRLNALCGTQAARDARVVVSLENRLSPEFVFDRIPNKHPLRRLTALPVPVPVLPRCGERLFASLVRGQGPVFPAIFRRRFSGDFNGVWNAALPRNLGRRLCALSRDLVRPVGCFLLGAAPASAIPVNQGIGAFLPRNTTIGARNLNPFIRFAHGLIVPLCAGGPSAN